MSDNLHRVIEDRRDTNSMHGRAVVLVACRAEARGSSPPAPFGLRRGSLHLAPRAKAGGARRDRTDDLLLAKQALSQLSYGPGCERYAPYVVGLGRLELPTSRLSSARSNQLSYKPNDRPRSSPVGMRAARARP